MIEEVSTQIKGEDITKIRDAALESTFMFGKIVCGFLDLDPDFHGMVMSKWVEKPTRFKLGMAPRGHFKSSLWTIADNLRRVTRDPDLEILIVNEKEGNITKWIHTMQEVVMSEIYQGLFPDRVPNPLKVRWNQNQLELKRKKAKPQANIEGMGVTSAMTSNHFDIICPDDIAGEEAYNSALVMQQTVEKRKRLPSLLKNMATSRIHDYCTRWGPNDPPSWLMKNIPDLDVLKLSVWRKPGIPWFPAFFPLEELEKLRRQYGPRDWALQYLNEIVGGDATRFDPDLLRNWTMVEDEEGNEIFVLETPLGEKRVKREECLAFQIIDAGLNPESNDARTANVTAFLTPPTDTSPFDIVIAEAKATRSTPAQVVEEAKKSYDRWGPLFASIETFGGHQAFFGWLSTTYPDMRIRELKKDFSRNAKHKRINGFWGSYPNQGRVYIHRSHTDLVDELVAYPNGLTVDLLDAAGYLPTVWAPPERKKPQRLLPPGVSAFDLADDWDYKEPIVLDGINPTTGY